MKKYLIVFFWLLSNWAMAQQAYLPNTIIVKFKYNFAKAPNFEKSLQDLCKKFPDIKSIDLFYPQFNPQKKSIPQELDFSCIYRIQISNEKHLNETLTALKKNISVAYAELYYLPTITKIPNDPGISQQYYLPIIKAFETHEITHGDTNIVVGIIDTGFDFYHEDLQDKTKYNYDDPINGIDDDNDMFIDNFSGWDMAENDNNPQYLLNHHGVRVAGLTAANTNNGIGIASIGHNTKLLPIKIMDDTYGNLIGAYEGILYAVDQGCAIVNCSWGGTTRTNLGQDVVNYATFSNCLVIASAGNDKNDVPFYPASYDGVLNVAGTNNNDNIYSSSTYGIEVDLCAPGEGIYSTAGNNSYAAGSGTSYASPIVAGAAALVKATRPELSAIQIAEQLRISSDIIDTIADNQFYYRKLGYGRLNAYNAVTKTDLPSIRIKEWQVEANQNTALLSGDTLRVSFSAQNILAQTTNTLIRLNIDSEYISALNNTTSLGQMETFESANNFTSPFTFIMDASIPTDHEMLCTFEIQDQGYSDYQQFNMSVNKSYMDVSNTTLTTTLTSHGKPGYYDRIENIGEGLIYQDENILYESGIILANSADNVASTLFETMDFETLSVIDTTFANNTLIGNTSYKALTEAFSNNISISQKTEIPFTENLSNSIIYNYTIKNNESFQIENLRMAFFTLWNFNGHTRSEFNEEYNLLYTYSTSNDVMYGAILFLGNQAATPYGFDLTEDGNGGIDIVVDFALPFPQSFEYPDQFKWFTMTNPRPEAGSDSISSASQLSSPAYTIAANDSINASFALIAGRNYLEILETAQDVIDYYNQVSFPLTLANNDPVIYPNPSKQKLHLKYQPKSKLKLYIYNTQGALIMQSEQLTTDLSHLKDGLYLLKIKDGNQCFYKKFILSK